jgi:hypothetical protein
VKIWQEFCSTVQRYLYVFNNSINFVQIRTLFFILCLLCGCQQYKVFAISAYNSVIWTSRSYFFGVQIPVLIEKYWSLVLFSRLSNDTVVTIVLLLTKLLYPSENDDQNSTLEDKYGTEH